MKTQKGVTPILIVILVAILGLGGYFAYTSLRGGAANVAISPVQPATYSTPQPSPPADETANWKTYTITPDSSLGYEDYQIKLPADWKQIEHSSNFQGTEIFQDMQSFLNQIPFTYRLTIEEQKNHNEKTGKPFMNLKELSGFPYDIPIITVDGQQAIRLLPRAGSEYIYKAAFFSKDTKLIYSITLETPSNGSKIHEGEVLFNQILSTFRFTQ